MATKNKPANTFVVDMDELEQQEAAEATVAVERDAAVPSPGVNVIDLPSAGKLGYSAFAEYRDIMVKDEEVLATATIDTYAKTLNAVVKSVMNDCPFYEKLSIHDRDFMLVWLWAQNYSKTKTLNITCAHCQNEAVHVVDMTQLPQREIAPDFRASFQLPLKKTGGTITVSHPTVGDELFAEEYTRKNKAKGVKFETVLLVRAIDVGMPAIPFDVKFKWVTENVSGREMAIIRQFHAKFSFGIETGLEHKCGVCGEVTRGDIPFQAEDILFPTVSDDIEKYL